MSFESPQDELKIFDYPVPIEVAAETPPKKVKKTLEQKMAIMAAQEATLKAAWVASHQGEVAAKAAMEAAALKPLSEAEWSALSGKAKWDSQVALRGPDLTQSHNLKYFTTSVIRWRLSKVMRVGGLVNGVVPFVVLPAGLTLSGLYGRWDGNHFLNHIYEAACHLNITVAWVEPEGFSKVLLNTTGHYYVAELMLYQIMEDSPSRTALGNVILAKGQKLEAPSCPE